MVISTTGVQVKLLAYVDRLLPPSTVVTLVGDCEFGKPLLMEKLCLWGWEYALRQLGDHLVKLPGTKMGQRLDQLPLLKGNRSGWVVSG